ncbi:LPXTG cell wall anchor domain-containing protein, partial [Nonomuraea diastatica]
HDDGPAPAAKPRKERDTDRAEPRHEPRDAAPGERAGRHEPRSAAHDRAPRAERLDQRPLPMTGVSIWMLVLGTAVLLAIGLLVRYFSRRDRASGIP